MSNDSLMQSIKDRWGKLIDEAVSTSSIPASFIAALIANESGGNPDAHHYELSVHNRLRVLQQGITTHYDALTAAQVVGMDDNLLADLATSFGLTQIMGYHAFLDGHAPFDLEGPSYSLYLTVKVLAMFAQRFGLDLTTDFEDLFRCWNTGRPNRKTFDPNYISNGLLRKAIYESLSS